eukprot:XP_011671409.1 PREDICTED: uncharacterized protein LOC105441715 [Strongylocentrotus purpuratus]
MGKHCGFGTCNSDSRYAKRPDMEGVFFLAFPKPKTKLDKCKIWLKACGRKDFGVDNVTKHTYVCSKHFVGGKGPTAEHPNPLPATATQLEKQLAAKPVRPSPRDRHHTIPPPKRRKTEDIGLKAIDEIEIEGEEPNNPFADDDFKMYRTTETQSSVRFHHLKDFTDDELSDHQFLMRTKFVEQITKTDKKCMFYTGIYWHCTLH